MVKVVAMMFTVLRLVKKMLLHFRCNSKRSKSFNI